MAKNDVFRRFGRFGNLHRSFGRTDSAEIGRSFGRSFGFGRTLAKNDIFAVSADSATSTEASAELIRPKLVEASAEASVSVVH